MIRLALLRLIESLFRYFWLYMLPIVIAAAASGFFALREKPSYTSAGSIYVQGSSLVSSLTDLPGNGTAAWVTPSSVFVSEISALMKTEAFMRRVAAGTSLEAKMNKSQEDLNKAMADLSKNLAVASVNDNLVGFSATAEDADTAYLLAQHLPESYVVWKLNSNKQDSQAAEEFFQKQLDPLKQELETARQAQLEYLLAHPAPERGERPGDELVKVDQLQSAVKQAEDRVQDVQSKVESAQLAKDQAERNLRQMYLIIDAPLRADEPTNGLRKRLMENIIFVIAGFLLSIIAIVGVAVLDPSLRFPIDVNNRLSLPVLAMPPRSRVRKELLAAAMPAASPGEPAAEPPAAEPAAQPMPGALAQSTQE
ncbi:hypothetical protein F8S13_04895 [Chloroflexia bacterium SDU3-3]|nr:hypothetical protein F8S13_04895 [Chloroflexia bacterium SDU3-3]